MDIFSEFAALHPGVAFEFIASIKALNLLGGETDIAIRVTLREPDAALICRKVGAEHWALFGGQGYAERFGLPKSPDDLQGHRFVTFKHADVPDFLHAWLVERVSRDQITMSVSELDLMLASIRAGHGLGLVPARFAESDKSLVRCFGNIAELSRTVMMLIAPEAYRRPEIKAFAKFFAPRYAATFN